MPLIKSAKKKNIQDKKRTLKNRKMLKEMNKLVKNFRKLAGSNPDEAQKKLNSIYSSIDKAAKKNILHQNKAARKKSQVAKLLVIKKVKKIKTAKAKTAKSPAVTE
jgi:small subunit ribosomal protein S20